MADSFGPMRDADADDGVTGIGTDSGSPRKEPIRVLVVDDNFVNVKLLEELLKSASYEVATAYVLLEEKDQAFRWFDKAVEDRSDCMVALAVDPRLDSLRSDPRFQDLQRRVGLPR